MTGFLKLRRLLRATALLLGTAIVLAASIQNSAPAKADAGLFRESDLGVSARDVTAESTRTVRAWDDDPGILLFRTEFTATTPGQTRRVRAHVVVTQPASSTDELLMVNVSLSCKGIDSGNTSVTSQSLGQTQNVLRGTSIALEPRVVFAPSKTGRYQCNLSASGGRPRPASPDLSPESNIYYFDNGSYLEVTTPIHSMSAQEHSPKTAGDYNTDVLENGEAYDAAALEWTAPQGAESVWVTGDVKLTACTAVGGSTDPITGQQLCQGRVNYDGAHVTTLLHALQRRADGTGYCMMQNWPDERIRTFISRDVHHQQIYHGASFAISPDRACSRQIRIKVYVKHVSGSAVIVHHQGTISAAILPGT